MIDSHIHSKYSADSVSDPQSVISSAINKGFKVITFTDHYDLHYCNNIDMTFDIDDYFRELLELKEKYRDFIKVLIGIEVGLQKAFSKEIRDIILKYPFDFIIGSTHLIHGVDPYYGTLFTNESEKNEEITDYLNVILENLNSYDLYDSMGHLDYVKRYTKYSDSLIRYSDHSDKIDLILEHLIANEKAFEINTSGYDRFPFDFDILKRYKELGGKYVTIGSDSHEPNQLGRFFDKCFELIRASGFDHLTYYENRKPIQIDIE